MPLMRLPAVALAAASVMMASAPAHAAAVDPAVAKVEAFQDALLASARQGGTQATRIRPLVVENFNIPVMAMFTVGPAWAAFSPGERMALVDAMTRYTAARYAHEFNGGAPTRFVTQPIAQVRGVDRLVKAEAFEPGEAPAKLFYRVREYGASWKIIDVFYEGVSVLATQRADFAPALASGGVPNLIRKLDEATARFR